MTEKSKTGDLAFALFHLALLLAVAGYGLYSLIFHGNRIRFALIFGGLLLYYVLVLHKPVVREIRRKRGRPPLPPSPKPPDSKGKTATSVIPKTKTRPKREPQAKAGRKTGSGAKKPSGRGISKKKS